MSDAASADSKVSQGRPPDFDFAALQPVGVFDALVDPSAYVRLPDDWVLGLADVVDSTGSIDEGRYKAVNTAGAAVISAVANALHRIEFPFVFSGDGASFAIAPEYADAAGTALAATVAWVGAELGLVLRGGLLHVGEIRAAGYEVKVARFSASPDVRYAMFSGGGRAWAEGQLKTGHLTLPRVPKGMRPDLSGLSCRFEDIKAAHGLILSLIVRPVDERGEEALGVLGEIVRIAGRQARAAHPVPAEGPKLRWPARGIGIEAKLQRSAGMPVFLNRIAVAARAAFVHALMWRDKDVGGFSPARYRRQMVDNSDFRKFDDGLMMTLDCPVGVADEIEALLKSAQQAGLVRYGVHRQSSALVTCMVPSALRPDHIHFIDGASGGYAMAARDLKAPAG